MASSFATQLRNIAQNSTHELDLRARRTAHGESLLFSKEIAVKQDLETIYAICIEGFRELCTLDAVFIEFDRNLFSPQSIKTEREHMNKSENEALDKVLERCLAMLGGRLLLKPAIRCLEWLVRRFKVHVHNSAAVLLAVLPWHEMSIWRNVLSIIPKERCTADWKHLGMYKAEALNVPRSTLVHAMTNNDGFFALLNRYVLDAAREGISNTALLKFWNGIVVEALIDRLAAARSGRKEVQRQRIEDLLLKVLPVLSDGFEVRDCPELITASFTLAMVLAGKADLDDRVLDSLLQAVAIAGGYLEIEKKDALLTIAVVVGQKQKKSVPKAVLDFIMHMSNFEATLLDLNSEYQVSVLIEALVAGALLGIKKKNVERRLTFVESVLRFGNSLTQEAVNIATQVVLLRILNLRTNDRFENLLRTRLLELLRHLNEERSFSVAIQMASQSLNQDSTQIEAMLGANVAAIEAAPAPTTDAMDIDSPTPAKKDTQDILNSIPTRTADTTSFLAKYDQHLYEQLVRCFTTCYKSSASLQQFISMPIWQSSPSKDLLLHTLLLRISVGPFEEVQRSVALRLLASELKNRSAGVDAQTILPYALVAISDPLQRVRQSAAELLIAIEQLDSSDEDETAQLGVQYVYEKSQSSAVKWIPTGHVKKTIDQAILPDIEECVLDASRVTQLVKTALNGNDLPKQTPTRTGPSELKKSLRHDLFDLLTSHAVATPLLRVKIQVIRLLADVNKVGTSSKSKALISVLEAWSALDETTAAKAAKMEQLTLSEVDSAMTGIISSRDRDAANRILDILETKGRVLRAGLTAALFDRLQELWKGLKHDTQVSIAQKMFDLAFQSDAAISRNSQSILRTVDLTTDTLGLLLEQSTSAIPPVQNTDQQPKKRRRTSHGRDSVPPDMAEVMKTGSARLTFALELIDDSSPETRPELLPALFDTLLSLKRVKQRGTSLPYLHHICLNNINAIVEAQRTLPRTMVDMSSIRADLVTDCITSSENPQVQTSALLLSANLAAIAPDRVLHNIMPIFTFMGQKMFSNDDEHSVHVVNQAIDKIIPALVTSLRNQNKDLVKSTSSLLASFTAAFDHIPQHRRVSTYARLLNRMGAEEFTFVVIAMLAQRKAYNVVFDAFLHDLLSHLDARALLITLQRLVDLANDVLSPQPQLAREVFSLSETTSPDERQSLAQGIFRIALSLLQTKSLRAQTSKLHKLDADLAQGLRTEIDSAFRLILTTIRDRRRDGSDVIEEAKQCLDALLALPSLTELFNILPQALMNEEIDEDLKPQALRVLATQLHGNPSKDKTTRIAAIGLLNELTEMLQDDLDVAMKQAIIVCVDRLSEVYGRKDIETVVAAANIVAGDRCLGSCDLRLEVMSSLCLASMLEVLQEACIPIVPEMMPTVIQILKAVANQNAADEELHNAIFTLITAVVSHVPFLVSDNDLHALLILSSLSASKYPSNAAKESRHETLSTLALKVDLASLTAALLGEDLNAAREHPEDAELEKLDMLSTAIERAPKAEIVKNAESISQLLLAHLDQRARILSAGDAVDNELEQAVYRVEDKVNIVLVQFIYKLNDTAFRPVFESWVDWATNVYDIEEAPLRNVMLPLRRTSLFKLLTHFFDTLKSIVTSYASYLIPLSNQILTNTVALADAKGLSLTSIDNTYYASLLTMLRTAFSHDVDGFYNTPSHFEPVASPLVFQLKLAASKSLRNIVNNEVIPTIIALATATLDTPSHHQAISHGLVQLRHSPSAAVRLASIKTFAALTSEEDVGEEFIANVIGIGSGEGEGARGIGGGGSVGEIMIYVNEMLEDDDEDVEREVRKWVQIVREKTGEDVFEV